MEKRLKSVDPFHCSVSIVWMFQGEPEDTLCKLSKTRRTGLGSKTHPGRVDHRETGTMRNIVMCREDMLDYMHRKSSSGTDLHPPVKGDNRRPLHLGSCFKIISIGYCFWPPLHSGENDPFSEAILKRGTIGAIEV